VIATFFPEFAQKINLRSISGFTPPLPAGRYAQRLSGLSGSHQPLELIATLYMEFRDVLFKGHSSLKLFKYLDHRPQDQVDDSFQFLWSFVNSLGFMMAIAPPDIVEMLSHCISIDIYGRPLSVHTRTLPEAPMPQVSRHRRDIQFEERALIAIRKSSPLQFTKPVHLPTLEVVASPLSGLTVVSRAIVLPGELLCELYGAVATLEEFDDKSERPLPTQIWLTGTPLMIDTSEFAKNAIYSRIRRSVFFNCEARVFFLNGKPRVGLFSVGPAILPMIGERQKRSDAPAIRPGDELLMPFDLMPVIPKFDCESRTQKSRRPEIDLEALRPRQHAPIPQEVEADADEADDGFPEAGSLAAFFAEEGELQFRVTPSQGLAPLRSDFPTGITKLPVPGLKPVPDRLPVFEAERTRDLRHRDPEIPALASRVTVLQRLATVRPREPWDLTADCLYVTDSDLRY
jgi:hypothetical protein